MSTAGVARPTTRQVGNGSFSLTRSCVTARRFLRWAVSLGWRQQNQRREQASSPVDRDLVVVREPGSPGDGAPGPGLGRSDGFGDEDFLPGVAAVRGVVAGGPVLERTPGVSDPGPLGGLELEGLLDAVRGRVRGPGACLALRTGSAGMCWSEGGGKGGPMEVWPVEDSQEATPKAPLRLRVDGRRALGPAGGAFARILRYRGCGEGQGVGFR